MGTAQANTGFKVYVGPETVYANTLFATGRNDYGTIGDGTTNSTRTFKQVGTLTDWSQLSYGQNWTAAIKTNGTLWTWGYNGNVGGFNGFLGIGTTISYSSPIQVGSLTNWSSLSIDGYSGLAIKTDGTLWAWGRNEHGQLGTATNVGTTTCFSSPIQIGSLTDYSQVNTSGAHTMFVKTNGTLWGCGYAKNGALGNGVTVSGNPGRYPSPIQIGSLTNWSRVLCGYNTGLALKTDGTLWAWGMGTYGMLGNGTTITYASPIQVGSDTNWSKISSGSSAWFAIKTNGTLWACGYNAYGTLGNGTTIRYSSPIQIGSLTNWSNISTADNVTLATKTDGTLWVCGYNAYGSLGDGSTINKSSPIQIGNYNNWGNVFAGSTSFAIPSPTRTFDLQQDLGQRYVSKDYLLDVYPNIASATGARTSPGLWAWGQGVYSALGNGTTIQYSSPVQIGSLTNWKQVSVNITNSAAIKTDGTLWTWGGNNYGQLGNGGTLSGIAGYSSPIQIGSLTNWKQVVAGYSMGAIKTDGTLWTWGWNTVGQLGIGNRTDTYTPIQVGLLTNWKQVSCGSSGGTFYAIKTNGTLWAWGDGYLGRLGNGLGLNTTAYSSPIQIGSLTNWSQVSGGGGHAAAVKTDGTLWTWGFDAYGQLGNGTAINYSSPIQVGLLTNWKQVSAGEGTTAAIKTDGTLWIWGRGGLGTMGNGTRTNYSSPIQVGLLTNWKQVSCRYLGAAAIKTDGTLWTWGYNGYGMLGNGTQIEHSSPIQIGSLTNWKEIDTYINMAAIADGYY